MHTYNINLPGKQTHHNVDLKTKIFSFILLILACDCNLHYKTVSSQFIYIQQKRYSGPVINTSFTLQYIQRI